MLRTHNCGELRIADINKDIVLCGWVQRIRDKGGMIWLDLRDYYGKTQLIFEEGKSEESLLKEVRNLGREFVISVSGTVQERISKNSNIPTGDIEVFVKDMTILNESKVPPFLIEDETDGGEDLRMKYRYLDLRREPLHENLKLRHQLLKLSRQYLNNRNFIEIETPFMIKSTPEGARDFVVPSREHPGEFYALPQSPQTFKQLLMISGFDQYFQIVKCFRDEDLRADRQPEFTQIDCEMSFVEREDVLQMFEGLMKFLFREVKGIELPDFPLMTYEEAIQRYGTDKPDLRFGFEIVELNSVTQGKGFNVFDKSELVAGICVKGCAPYSRKQLDELTEFVKKPQIGAKGLVYLKYNEDSTYKSSVDKFFKPEDFDHWIKKLNANPGDLILILAGETDHTRTALSELRIEMGNRLGLRNKNQFAPLWVVDFPLMEWDKETKRYYAMHHPFTSPKPGDFELLESNPGKAKANSYDLVINGIELGGGSIRIHKKELQQKMLEILGFTKEEAEEQFGFLMQAFEYGAPPHGGIAFGFDRICSLFGGTESIRDFIAFPKNNAGRDVMIDTPSKISNDQLKDLHLEIKN